MEEAKIIITVRPGKKEGELSSTHELININELTAGLILIEVGRDLLMALAQRHDHTHQMEEGSNGH